MTARAGIRGKALILGLLQSPAVLVAITVILLIDWLALPCGGADHSEAGSWHGCPRIAVHGQSVMGSAYRVPDGRLIWAFEDDPRLAPPAGAVPLDIRVFVDLVKRDGWWGLTRKSRGYFVWDATGATVTGAPLKEVQHALIEFRRTSGEWFGLDRVLDLVEAGSTREDSLLPLGYVHNALSAALAITFLACATCQTRRSLNRARSSRWAAQRRCVRCGYPRDPALLAPCPECGKADRADRAD